MMLFAVVRQFSAVSAPEEEPRGDCSHNEDDGSQEEDQVSFLRPSPTVSALIALITVACNSVLTSLRLHSRHVFSQIVILTIDDRN